MRLDWFRLLALLALPWSLVAGDGHARPPGAPDPGQVEQLITSLTNDFRGQERRRKVERSGQLAGATRYFAQYMARSGRFSHGADGSTPAARARQHGYDDCIVSENIAYQFNSAGFETRELAQAFVESWKKSPGHRKNMLDPDVTETAVAVARGGKAGEYYAVQMFGRPASQSMRFSLANQSNATVRYRLGGKTYTIAPRQVTTHTQCRREALKFDWPGPGREATLTPGNGDKLAVVRSGSGFSVKNE